MMRKGMPTGMPFYRSTPLVRFRCHFGPEPTPATFASVAIDPERKSDSSTRAELLPR